MCRWPQTLERPWAPLVVVTFCMVGGGGGYETLVPWESSRLLVTDSLNKTAQHRFTASPIRVRVHPGVT